MPSSAGITDENGDEETITEGESREITREDNGKKLYCRDTSHPNYYNKQNTVAETTIRAFCK